MKKGIFGVIAFFVLTSLFIQMTSAYYFPSVRGFSDSVVNSWVDFAEPILQALFGGYGWTGFYLFERLLLFIMFAGIVYLAVGRVPLFKEQKAVRWIIAIVVPLLGIRFIDYAWLSAVLEQYKALAIILMSIFPFIIYFMFIYNVAGNHGVVRKLGWLVFAGLYLGLWSGATSDETSAVYFWTVVAAAICLFGDNIIDRRYRAIERSKTEGYRKEMEVGRINDEIAKINEQIRNNHIDQRTGRELIKKLVSDKQYVMRHT